MIESLESRRMLAVFNGTANADTILIASAGGMTQVVINGASTFTSDDTVTVNALGGHDDVFFPVLKLHNGAGKNITVNLGDGDDSASNIDTVTGGGRFNDIQFDIVVNGNAGSDSLVVDNTDGGFNWDTILQQNVADTTVTIDVAAQPTAKFHFNTIEDLTLQGNDGPDFMKLESKPNALRVEALGADGDDVFTAGRFNNDPGTDLDFSEDGGWIFGTTTLFGGAGHDRITFEDRRAGSHVGGYLEESFTFTKNGRGFTYSAFEEQDILAAPNNSVNFNSMTSFIEDTFLFAPDCTVNFGNGNITSLSGTFDVNVPGPLAAINIFDHNDTGNDGYLLTTTDISTGQFKKNGTQTITYSNFHGTFSLFANQGANGINIQSTPNTAAIVVNGGGGDDSIAMGNGNIGANIRNNVSINGGAGTGNSMHFNNTLDTVGGTQTLNGLTFTDERQHTLSAINTILIENGTGGGSLNIDNVATFTAIASSSSSQTVNIGGGNLDANLLADCSVISATVVNIDDRLDTGNDGYIIDPTGYRKTTAGARDIDLSNFISTINLLASDGDNNIQVNNAGNNLRIFANGGNDAIIVADTKPNFAQEMISVDTGSDGGSQFGDRFHIDSDSGNPGDAPAHVRLLNTDSFGILSISRNGLFQIPTGVTGVITQGIGISGVIDFAGGALVMRGFGATMGIYEDKTAIGYANGAWNGTSTQGAFNSSLAASSALPDGVGYAKATDLSATFPFAFAGVQINAIDAVFRYTLYGDADLNGTVNFDDYSRTDLGFNQSRTGWSNGDFNFDDVINFDDYALIDLAFNTQG